MRENISSPTSLFRDILINLISGAAGVALGRYLEHPLISWFLLFFILSVVAVVWIWRRYARTIKLILATHPGYYYSFGHKENDLVINEAQKSFCYLGISSDSILEIFRQRVSKSTISCYRILLMKLDSPSLIKQEAFRKGYDLSVDFATIPSAIQHEIQAEAAATTTRIKGAIEVLKNMAIYKDGRLKLKLCDEFLPWWMYLIDDHTTYIGVLEKGKRGDQSPVMKLEKNSKYVGPFDAFQNNFERLWREAKDA